MKKTNYGYMVVKPLALLLGTYIFSVGAQDFYYGAGAGINHFHELGQFQGGRDSNTASVNMFAGYSLNDYLGAEVGYFHTGQGRAQDQPLSNHGLAYSIYGQEKLHGNLALQLEAGGVWSRSRGFGESDSKMAPLLGAALVYPISDDLSLRTRWRHMRNVSHLAINADGDTFSHNQNIATLELIYRPVISKQPQSVVVTDEVQQPLINEVEPHTIAIPDVHFDFSVSNMNPSGQIALKEIAKQIFAMTLDGKIVSVVGHSDRIGDEAFNLKLSTARAKSVADFLSSEGVPVDAMVYKGLGSLEPASNNGCDIMKSKNELKTCLAADRRVEIHITERERAGL
ncbi:OmpA family protein [Aeromonas veronii]|uniref:OmpA family protein n=1 Tax=Aeromonas TaxID=642 RepID=UPI001D0A9013|nr:OmpA family protein [Aeromonas veronii]UDN23619.1 OmpA family protein [Aeromonas veronii]